MYLRKNSLIGEKIIPFIMNRYESIDIDDEFDWTLAEFF